MIRVEIDARTMAQAGALAEKARVFFDSPENWHGDEIAVAVDASCEHKMRISGRAEK